jgi:peptidyl-prolyl cis-trans isomerase C
MLRILLVVPSIVLALSACDKPVAPSSSALPGTPAAGKGKTGDPTVLAEIGAVKLTAGEIQTRIDAQSPFVKVRYAEPARKAEFLESQVRFEALAAEARARGYDKDPDIEDAIKKMIVQRLTREEFDSRVKLSDITDAELQAYFSSHQSEYQKPKMARGSVVIVRKAADAQKKIDAVRALAADPKKAEDRAFFRELVEKNSTDETTRKEGGDLRYRSEEELAGAYGKTAAAWLFAKESPNEVSPVFEHEGNLLFFKRAALRPEVTRSFEQVKNQVKNVVYREKRSAAFDAYVKDLEKKFGAKSFPEKLDLVKVDATPPPGIDSHGHDGVHGPQGAVPLPGMLDDDADKNDSDVDAHHGA